MKRYLILFAICVLLVAVCLHIGYRLGRYVESESRAHPTDLPIIGLDAAGHLVSSLHWTDDSGTLKHWFISGPYTLNVWKTPHCTEDAE